MTEEKKTRQGMIADDKMRMSLVIPRDLKPKLEAVAKAEDRSVNKIIVRAIEYYIETHKQ